MTDPRDALHDEKMPLHQIRSATRRVLRDVSRERERQVTAEGWHHSHDDEHTDGELASAAACYAMPPDLEDRSVVNIDRPNVACPPDLWPWGPEAWKPTTRRRELVKAAALLIAEIERLDRAEARADRDQQDDAPSDPESTLKGAP